MHEPQSLADFTHAFFAGQQMVLSLAGVAADMLDFLREFLAVRPHLADNDLYITGESYAGHYVPAVAHRVWRFTRDAEGEEIRLKGFAIGAPEPASSYWTPTPPPALSLTAALAMLAGICALPGGPRVGCRERA